MNSVLDLLAENVRGLARGFVAQLPYIAVATAVFVAFLVAARLLRRLVRRTLRRQDVAIVGMVSQLVHVAVVVLGVFVALWIAIPTVEFAQIFTSLGVSGIVLGFALRDIIENFVAGILILWRRPFRVGDQIRSGAFEGNVAEINFRSTVLRTYDGIKVFIPNGKVFTEPVENLTANDTRRSLVVLGIDQDSSVAEAREVILEAIPEVDGVLPDPPPAVLFAEIGDFANILHVHYWTAPPTRFAELTTRSLVTERMYEALIAAGISFPYPIQTLQLDPDTGLGAAQAPLASTRPP
ncbi:MAG: mechanosensitive ion channel family protein [Chloroflexia bacterium]|nr:mechanosensitive ion channel family protein [Chloroflexia bacterium]